MPEPGLREAVAVAKAEQRALVVPGATDAITARVIEQLGFAAVYITGAGLANARFGYPDIGLVGMSEVVDHVAAIADTVDIPLIVDADTGWGNALNVQRTVRLLERAGASAIQLEDQVAPKRCGHFDGKEVIEADEMVQKLCAAVDARRSDTLIIARTDAAAVLGIDEALERAHLYRESGADILFVEAPTSREELARIPQEVSGTHVVNMVEGGRTPLLGQDELAGMGFTLIIYANSALRAAVFGVRDVLGHLFREGSTFGASDRLITWEERQDLVQKPVFDALEIKYGIQRSSTAMSATELVDLAVVNGRVVLPGDGVVNADLWVRDGKFAGIVARGTAVQATQVLDVAGQTVLPGAIDAHIHMGADITMAKSQEEVVGETASALAGGVTTVLAYLMSAKPYEELFPDAVGVMEEYSACDFGFHFCIGTQHQLDQLGAYVSDLGVSSFKFFMNFKGEEGKYLNLPSNDDGFLWQLLERSVDIGAMVNPHAENIELVWHLREAARAAGGPDLVAWNNARPPIVEAEAEARVAMFAEVIDASVYAVHCSSKLALDALTTRRATHDGIFIETCPHYLLLDQDIGIGTYGKVNPPLRTCADREALWQALADGDIDVVGSDHVPRHKSAKEKDIWSASAGFPGIETLLPLLLSEGHVRRGIPLERIVDVVATRPAQLFGLAPRKGVISVGSDADLAVVDFGATTVLAAERMHSAAAYTPYEGFEAAVAVTHTVLGGRVVASNGQVTAASGGRYLPRARSGRAALSALKSDALAVAGGA